MSNADKFFRGDTIVEVLLAIAVASFAIGTAYSIANNSLNRAVSARERNEALNIIENQISNLKLRYKYTAYANIDAFNTVFGVPPGFIATPPPTTTAAHFCLDQNAVDSTDAATWNPYPNSLDDTTVNDLNNAGWNAKCIKDGTYYMDIAAQVTSASENSANRTVYRVDVRWSEVGTGKLNDAIVYYRF